MGDRDTSYRRLFMHGALLRDLLACVLDARWVDQLDWDGLQALDTQLVSDRRQQRSADGAWRIPYLGGGRPDLVVLLMLEHQSRPDPLMALRVGAYVVLLYQALLRQKRIGLPLPPILPVVLYSGRRPWRAAADLAALVELSVPGLAGFQPRMRYLLIDEGALLRAGGLPDRNLAALLFRLEHSASIEQIPELLDTLVGVLRGPGFEELNRSFAAYVGQVVLARAQPIVPVSPVATLQELSMLIEEKPGLWARQWRREGRKEGRQEGAIIGQVAQLERMLIRKFGPLPDEVVRRIRTGNAQELEAWSLNFVDADRLEAVFSRKNG